MPETNVGFWWAVPHFCGDNITIFVIRVKKLQLDMLDRHATGMSPLTTLVVQLCGAVLLRIFRQCKWILSTDLTQTVRRNTA